MMSNTFDQNAGKNAILKPVPSTLAEQATTAAVLEDIRRDSHKIIKETVEVARDAQPFSWNIDTQDTARAWTSAAALPWVIWSTGMSVAYAMWLTSINHFGQSATAEH